MADNGNGRGITPREGFVSVAAVVGFVVVFAFWWSVADPRQRLDKIEQVALEAHKEFVLTYTTLREHKELQNLLATQINELQKKDEEVRQLILTKAQFEAWKVERDLYIADMVKRIDRMREDTREIQGRIVPREEITIAHNTFKDRFEQLYALYRETQKAFHDIEMREIPARNGGK